MNILGFINIAAIILAPVVSVIIGQKLQDRAKRRQDKMDIFKTLMTNRVYIWTTACVHALNIIDIVFADDKKVRSQWKAYYDKLCVSNPSEKLKPRSANFWKLSQNRLVTRIKSHGKLSRIPIFQRA